ncbi:hypothetical protein M405DRAFT_816491 [Rhizopogon salebrosus TDB-379]|nr:hypothetical protein M405DRAFT_816491 [Rhizopogon salebrosus TDB-379]
MPKLRTIVYPHLFSLFHRSFPLSSLLPSFIAPSLFHRSFPLSSLLPSFIASLSFPVVPAVFTISSGPSRALRRLNPDVAIEAPGFTISICWTSS